MVVFWAAMMVLEGLKREDLRCTQRYAITTASQVGSPAPGYAALQVPLCTMQGIGGLWVA